jgi:DNA helicase-2/ATP-dependent DNA helicase PcrA
MMKKMNKTIKTNNENFEKRYKKLNAEQKRAVDSIEGPLLVIAGPGSGKTEILSLRIGRILTETQVLASNILCLTFTEAAATNMRKRLAGLIGTEAYRVAIYTFHGFCTDIIQKYPEYFYGAAFYSPADELTQIQIMEEIFTALPAKHPLRSYHPEQGFVYLKDSLNNIGYLKKAGLEPEDFAEILSHNERVLKQFNKIIDGLFEGRLNKNDLMKFSVAADQMVDLGQKQGLDFPIAGFNNLATMAGESLLKAAEEALQEENTKPIAKWRDTWCKSEDDNSKVLKDTIYLEKARALGKIYSTYREQMHAHGYYDFDDMILDVLRVLKNNSELRYEIQEQYQYVLVDEFQDTNDAQMKILRLVSDAPVNEGKPNIMVVGDDDQAIYKFQGAEISNIINFKKMFNDVEVVTMTKNYRSHQDILDIASHIIRKGKGRLENLLPEIEKNLIASNPEIHQGDIIRKDFPTIAHEYHYVSREIKRRIETGENPAEIAVIGRKHWQLEELVSYMQGAGVPIRYEREQNVFKEPHIAQLIILSRFISSLVDKYKDEADELLPQILAFPFWAIPRETIWRVSLEAGRSFGKKNWLEVMLDYPDEQVKQVGRFLVNLGTRAQIEPLERILDDLVGAKMPLSVENEDDDTDSENKPKFQVCSADNEYISPFKSYYFSQDKFEHARAEYLSFLSSLRVFVNALREYKKGEVLTIKDLIQFVDLHEKNDLSLNDKSPFAKMGDAVNLMTAHGAKGLEFNTVFVLSCQDKIWAGRGMVSRLVLPSNLPIKPAGDNEDDQLRLFYVAITRARRHLFLTSYETEEDGGLSSRLRFLIAEEGEEKVLSREALKKVYLDNPKADEETLPETKEVLTASWLKYHTAPFLGEEKKLLLSLLDEYQMSVTHLNNFLNVEKGGPQYFLEQNLLRFPQSKSPSGSYGSAIHSTLENISLYLKKEGKMPEIDEVCEWFKKFLRRERLAKDDYTLFEERGLTALPIFLKDRATHFNAKDLVEFNFRDQGVNILGAHLTGKIDKIATDGGEVTVYDYKTGKARDEWDAGDDYDKTKLYEYERQLLYYKLLVENSRDLADKYKAKMGILEFVEPNQKTGKVSTLEMGFDEEKVERLTKLIAIVYQKIMNLDLPDVSKYKDKNNLENIKTFEEDLLTGKV